MKMLFGNKYVVGAIVFVVFQWLAYAIYSGDVISNSGRRRGQALVDLVTSLVEQFGQTGAAAIISVGGIVLALIAAYFTGRKAAA